MSPAGAISLALLQHDRHGRCRIAAAETQSLTGRQSSPSDPGFTWNIATALNNRGDVIVDGYQDWAVTASYRLSDGTLAKLEFPGSAWTSVEGINANGVIVGTYGTTDGQVHGFVARPR